MLAPPGWAQKFMQAETVLPCWHVQHQAACVCRWVNCLLIREVPFHLGFRLWDTYLAEGPRMKEFLVYVLASFLLQWSRPLASMDFQVQQLA